jgi:SAM-dependent methyltransferase
MNTPVATGYTLAFVRKNLPPRVSSVLEIGCGTGELAAALAAGGLGMLAIDSDPDCVSATARRGVECLQAAWPGDLGRRFDAILFTRSLHHIHRLGEAVAAARDALRPGGRLIVEDFRSEGAGPASSAWYKEQVRSLNAGGAFVDGFDRDEALNAEAIHDHDLSSSAEIEAALSTVFSIVRTQDSAYYFRYLETSLRELTAAEDMLSRELEAIASGSIQALGKRFVALN